MSIVTDMQWKAVEIGTTGRWFVAAVDGRQVTRTIATGLSEADAKLIAAAPQMAALLAGKYYGPVNAPWVAATNHRIELAMADIGGPSIWHGRAL